MFWGLFECWKFCEVVKRCWGFRKKSHISLCRNQDEISSEESGCLCGSSCSRPESLSRDIFSPFSSSLSIPWWWVKMTLSSDTCQFLTIHFGSSSWIPGTSSTWPYPFAIASTHKMEVPGEDTYMSLKMNKPWDIAPPCFWSQETWRDVYKWPYIFVISTHWWDDTFISRKESTFCLGFLSFICVPCMALCRAILGWPWSLEIGDSLAGFVCL